MKIRKKTKQELCWEAAVEKSELNLPWDSLFKHDKTPLSSQSPMILQTRCKRVHSFFIYSTNNNNIIVIRSGGRRMQLPQALLPHPPNTQKLPCVQSGEHGSEVGCKLSVKNRSLLKRAEQASQLRGISRLR